MSWPDIKLPLQNKQAYYNVFSISACPKGTITLTQPMNLTSPKYPSAYPNNLDCRFLVMAPEGSTIDVKVADLDLGDTVDDVILNDGDNKQSAMMTAINKGFMQSMYAKL